MKLNSSLGIIVMIGTFFLSFGVNQATSKPTKIYFGLQQDAAPISYKDGVGNWQGYCNAFIEVLKKKTPLDIEIVPVISQYRFTGIGSNGQKLDAECGPDTITKGRESKELKENSRNGKFSEPFAFTGAGTLVSDEKNIYFNPNNRAELKQLKFGVIKGTTTRMLVEAKYPDNNIILLKDRTDAIKQIKDGTIDAYFNDELILIEMLKSLNSNLSNNQKKYSILSGPLSEEDYGIVVFHVDQHENSSLLEKINNLLTTVEFKSFGDTKIKLFDSPEFNEFRKDISPTESSPVNSPESLPVSSPVNSPVSSPVSSPVNSPVSSPVSLLVSSLYFYAFLIIIFFIIVVFILNKKDVIINNFFHPRNIGRDDNNIQGDKNRAVQGDKNQAGLGDENQVKQQKQEGTDDGES